MKNEEDSDEKDLDGSDKKKDDKEKETDQSKNDCDEQNENETSNRRETDLSSNLVRPWLSYAMALQTGLENQLNTADQSISMLDSNENNNSTENNDINTTLTQLAVNQRNIMSNVLSSLTNVAKNVDQSCLKPNQFKELNDKNKMNDEKSKNKKRKNRSKQKTQQSNDQQMNSINPEQSNQEQIQIDPERSNTLNTEMLFNIIQNEFKCSICQEIIVNATSLRCSHVFCRTCIDEWLTKNYRCPVCRTNILHSGYNRYHILPIDNFLSLYYQNFCTTDEQSNRTRLINEHRSKEVIVINDDDTPASSIRHNATFDLIQFDEIENTRLRNRNRHRRRRENRRAERLRRLQRLDQIDGINLNNSLGLSLINDTDSLNRLNPLDRATTRQTSRERSPIDRQIREIAFPIEDLSSLNVSPPSEFRINVDELISSDDYPMVAVEIDMVDLNEDDEPTFNSIDELFADTNLIVGPPNRSNSRRLNRSSNTNSSSTNVTPSSRNRFENITNRSTNNRSTNLSTGRLNNRSTTNRSLTNRSTTNTLTNESNAQPNRPSLNRSSNNRSSTSSIRPTRRSSTGRIRRRRSRIASSTPNVSSRRSRRRSINLSTRSPTRRSTTNSITDARPNRERMISSTTTNMRTRSSNLAISPHISTIRANRRRRERQRESRRQELRRARRSNINDFLLDR